jgi:hypothetical protein
MQSFDRRCFMRSAIETVIVAEFLRMSIVKSAIAAPVAPLFDRWVAGLNELARDLNATKLTLVQWQERIEALNKAVPLEDLLRQIDFDRLKLSLSARRQGELHHQVNLPGIDQPTSKCWSAVYAVAKGDAIPPHGHTNLLTAHMVLAGGFRARTFDRVAEQPGRVILRPRRDAHAGPGTTISMSDDHDNVHWFVAEEGPAFTFDIGMLPPTRRNFTNMSGPDGRVYLDPIIEVTDGAGMIEAAVIDHRTSIAKFGRGMG